MDGFCPHRQSSMWGFLPFQTCPNHPFVRSKKELWWFPTNGWEYLGMDNTGFKELQLGFYQASAISRLETQKSLSQFLFWRLQYLTREVQSDAPARSSVPNQPTASSRGLNDARLHPFPRCSLRKTISAKRIEQCQKAIVTSIIIGEWGFLYRS